MSKVPPYPGEFDPNNVNEEDMQWWGEETLAVGDEQRAAPSEATQDELAELAEERREKSAQARQVGGGVDMTADEFLDTREKVRHQGFADLKAALPDVNHKKDQPRLELQPTAEPDLAERRKEADNERGLFLDSWRAGRRHLRTRRRGHEREPNPDRVLTNLNFGQVIDLMTDDVAYDQLLKHEQDNGSPHPLKEAVRLMAGGDENLGQKLIEEISPDSRQTVALYRWLRNSHYDKYFYLTRAQTIRFLAAGQMYSALLAAGNSHKSVAKWMMLGDVGDRSGATPAQLFEYEHEDNLGRMQHRALAATEAKIGQQRRHPDEVAS